MIEGVAPLRQFKSSLFKYLLRSAFLNTYDSGHPEMVDFDSGQGRSYFATAGVVTLLRGLQKSENAGLSRKMPFLGG